jgi:predicted RND superfamily exporter protein
MMMKLVEFSVRRPRVVFALTGLLTVLAGVQFRKLTTDTNPKNMLPAGSDVRVRNREVEKTFALYDDAIVVGIRNGDTVLNTTTLQNVHKLTEEIARIDGVAEQDVTSLSTITNVDAQGDELRVAALMPTPPRTNAEVEELRKELKENPLFRNRVVSDDLKMTAIYAPLRPGANGKVVADAVRGLVASLGGGDTYYVAGDPVVRDTFGAEMFRAMAVFAPIAGLIMMGLAFWMFRRLSVAMTVMLTSMVIIIWSMGAVIGAGYPVHIMTSMAPVFLMAIATDAIHIFNEYFYRLTEKGDKRTAIIETMKATRLPLIYTDLTTAFAFGSLAFAAIIPVKVFGVCVALGTLALLLVSFTLVPAIMTTLSPVARVRKAEDSEPLSSRVLRAIAGLGTRRYVPVLLACVVLLGFATWGMSRLTVNNNQVAWFKAGSDIRVADSALNAALGGTATANIVLSGPADGAFKTTEGLGYVDRVQEALLKLPDVGAALSLSDYVKRINQVLHGGARAAFRLPDESNAIAQYVFLMSTSARPSDIANVADGDFRNANILLQLKTWDVSAMKKVVSVLDEQSRAAPAGYSVRPAGTAYFGLVWNGEVLWDMLKSFVFGLLAVLLLLAINFRSLKWALVSYVPLAVTIALIYGFIGFVGKDFDMPIAVLSCLSLGMAVDFSIHFVGRLRQRVNDSAPVRSGDATAQTPALVDALLWTAGRPGRGILRNAILFAAAFAVMLAAPLTPYVTVGAFMVTMMLLSGLLTILLLPSVIVAFRRWLFKPLGAHQGSAAQGAATRLGTKSVP